MWEQGLDWLRGNSPLQLQAYALVTGTLYFGAFWLIDHAGSYAMVQWMPNTTGSIHFRRNVLSLLRRILLLCSTTVLMAVDYGPLIYPLLPAQIQQLPSTFWAFPLSVLVIAYALRLELWIFRKLLPPNLSPSVADFVRMSGKSKQTLIGTPGYGTLSANLNRALYVLAYVHLVWFFYEAKKN